MEILSPYYDPDWEKRHDAATLAWECCQHALRAVHKLGGGASPEDVVLAQCYDAVAEKVQATFVAQFRTVQEYAAWVFQWLPGKEWLDEVPDFESFMSIEEVRAAAEKAAERIGMKRARKEHGMPIGQPEGLAAFDEPANVSSRFHVFAPGEIWRNESLSSFDDLPCIVNYQQISNEHHFSITHERVAFTKMASALAIEIATWKVPGIREIFASGTYDRWRNRRQMKQFIAFTRQCHFYEHFPHTKHFVETFSKVALKWSGAGFVEAPAGRQRYGSLPESIRLANDWWQRAPAPHLRGRVPPGYMAA